MYKYIKDPVYDSYLKFSLEEYKFIDTAEFKRLKNINQPLWLLLFNIFLFPLLKTSNLHQLLWLILVIY